MSASYVLLFLYSTYQRLNKLHAVVLGRIVGSCDHYTDPFALQSARSEGGNETNACEDRVEDIAAAVSFKLRSWVGTGGSNGEPYALVRNYAGI